MNHKRLRHVESDWRSNPHPESHPFRRSAMPQAHLDHLREQIAARRKTNHRKAAASFVLGVIVALALITLFGTQEQCLASGAPAQACTD